MARYELRFRTSAARDLRGVPKTDVRRILMRIESLQEDPRAPGSEKLSEQEAYRVRQGDHRIIYTVSDKTMEVEIVKIGHRRDAYRES
ncbi:MAG TPA: type II toxin-antitoxin system RelE/ParE family toxin [Casimicrobiaceae bacterium]|jgi:mRNA interferase RelE/StbE